MADGFTWVIKLDLIPAIIASMDAKTDAVVDTAATPVLQDIKDRSPVDTGAMRDGYYKTRTGPGSVEIRSADDLVYPWFIEFGHHTRSGSWVPAQPHFVPAFDAAQDAMLVAAKSAGLFEP